LGSFDVGPHPDIAHLAATMLTQLLACENFLDGIIEATCLEIAIEGAAVARRHRAGARTLTELIGFRDFPELPPGAAIYEPSVRVKIDRWIVELIEELVESRKPSHIRAFVREAVLAYVDQMAAGTGTSGPAA
jgi:hypothetical protein